MVLLDSFMPSWSLREVDRVAVSADPARAYAVARNVDFYRLGFVRLLFELRTVPDRIVARARGDRYEGIRSSRIDDIARAGSGFQVLGEERGREIVVGAIGKVWKPAIEFVTIAPSEYAAFDRAGFAKVAWCIRVDPREGGGSFVSFEVRVDATDAGSWTKFTRYWWIIGRFSHAIRRSLLREIVSDLGAAPSEDAGPIEGDDILAARGGGGSPRVIVQRTHAVTIEAPPKEVWPWLVQIGAGRAGWYSYDRLDNGGVRSADRIVPELQDLSVGDVIPALPDTPGGFAVLRLVPERALVIGDPSLQPGVPKVGGPPWRTTWAFVLQPIGTCATRLVVRVRADYAPSPVMGLVRPVLLAVHEAMERRQLHNLRARAEAAAA